MVKTTPAAPVASQDASSLANLLSKVDVSPAELLSALSKVQGQGNLEGEKERQMFSLKTCIMNLNNYSL